eukprot:GHVP01054321.1.p1 GENE.GHVP01054321.1~~GHVP01054321.1.p1  ORF type:complete len:664 (+),score=125.40 GHVP01054321.1:7-1998(+)
MDNTFYEMDWDTVDLLTLEDSLVNNIQNIKLKQNQERKINVEEKMKLLKEIRSIHKEGEYIERTLNKYTSSLTETDTETQKILEISKRLEIQMENQSILQEAIDNLIECLTIDKSFNSTLRQGDLYQQDSIETIINILSVLDQKIKQTFEFEISKITMVKERLQIFSEYQDKFSIRLESLFSDYFTSKNSYSGWLLPDSNKGIEMLKWSKFFEFLRDTFPKRHITVTSSYIKSIGDAYSKDLKKVTEVLLKCELSTVPNASSYTSLILFKNEADRPETTPLFIGDAIDYIIISLSQCISEERELLATLINGLDLSTIDTRGTRKINGSLESMFSPLIEDMEMLITNLCKRSGDSIVNALIVTDNRLIEKKSPSISFFDNILSSLSNITNTIFDEYIAEKIDKITVFSVKKRNEKYLDFVLWFSSFSDSVEASIEKTLKSLEQRMKKLKQKKKPILASSTKIIEAYGLIIEKIKFIFEKSIKQCTIDKEKENGNITLLQNTFRLSNINSKTSVLVEFVNEMKEDSMKYLTVYSNDTIDLLFGSISLFFSDLNKKMELAIVEDEDPADIALSVRFSKEMASKELGGLTSKSFTKLVDKIYQRISKHFKSTEQVKMFVLDRVISDSINRIKIFEKCIAIVYKSSLVNQLNITEEFIRNTFNSIISS